VKEKKRRRRRRRRRRRCEGEEECSYLTK